MTFSLTMHPATEGDCLQLTWGSGADLYHAIIDLGRTSDYRRLRDKLVALKTLELFVMTHIDADHIQGAMPLVREKQAPFVVKDTWFNAYHHLMAATDRLKTHDYESYGAKQGEKLSTGIIRFVWPWNAHFGGLPVSLQSAAAKQPIELAGGLCIRLLSPTDAKLAALAPDWLAELKEAGLRPFEPDKVAPKAAEGWEEFGGAPNVEALAKLPYEPDPRTPNGSSIAFVAEFEGKRVLLTGDAHSETLEAALAPLAAAEGGRYRVDLLKVSHHGSRANTSPKLLSLLDCRQFAFSTNGNQHQHPHPETVARILVNDRDRPKKLVFNFRQPQTTVWAAKGLQKRYRYECCLPANEEPQSTTITLA